MRLRKPNDGGVRGRSEDLGIPKIQLMVRAENHTTARFYRRIGYKVGEFIFLSKRLGQDEAGD